MPALIYALLPLGLVFALWLLVQASGVRQAKEEKHALRYCKALLRLMLEIQQHRGMANTYLNGDASFRVKLTDAQDRIDGIVNGFDKDKTILQGSPSAFALWKTFKSDWKNLRGCTLDLTPPESFARHSQLVERILLLKQQLADLTGMTADPHPYSYGLLDTLISKLPGLLENVARARGLGSGIAARGKITMAEKMQLISLATLIQSSLASLGKTRSDGSPASPETNTAGNILAFDEFLQFMTSQLIDCGDIKLSAEQYFASGTKAIDAGNGFYEATEKKLKGIFDDRIGVYRSQLRLATFAALAVAAAAVYMTPPA